ncbi:hypothetical protein ACFY12_18155 [Streptomyces sp. NPDC001339]|uniref:DUF7848 domain-containing protein n=1 Tax=Streptomyces sp. NPDC001339 TaxID=3364563 RepID=UPI00368C2CB1
MDLRHVGKCLICAEFCVDTAAPDEAQDWCLKHAGATGHTHYEMAAFQYFDAILTDPRRWTAATADELQGVTA